MAPIRLGMVGGGPGSGIGPAHRYGAALDSRFELLAGAFSRNAEKSGQTGAELRLDPERIYPDFQTMAAVEGARPDGIEAVAIVTPNDSHAPACLAFIEQGVHVICDKPLATSYRDAVSIYQAGRAAGLLVGLTHVYASYSMAHEARGRIADGELGRLRLVQAEYVSGSRTALVEARGDEKTGWRMDPAIAGPSSVLGDIGTHAHHLARFMTGLEVEQVSADIQTFVEGRKGDDNAEVNLRFSDNVRGHLWASVIAAGMGNGLRIRIFGDRGSLEWAQEAPDQLWLRPLGDSPRLLRRGEAWLGDEAGRTSRMKIGHPQGVLEAFANFYCDAAAAIREAQQNGRAPVSPPIATAWDGVLGMKFVEACVASSRQNGQWTDATVDLEAPDGD